ncbi:MAG: sulfur carrier protein ThiS adenylyltransferase ThiF [Pseudomonadota bacterium]
MNVIVNERKHSVPADLTVGELKKQIRPEADIIIVNGCPSGSGKKLKEGDRVVFIRRGEVPRADELEALMMARHTPGVHERMKASTVGIAGLGGLGSAVAIALTRMGVGALILCDSDVVEPSNLNRQHYAIEHIGMAKTDAMAKILASINPYIRVIFHNVLLNKENIPVLFKEAKVVVECFDKPEAKAMIVSTVAEFLPETFVIGASGVAGYGDSNTIKTIKLGEKIFMVGDFVKAAEPGRGLMAPRVGIAAHHQANLVVSLLMDPEHLEL